MRVTVIGRVGELGQQLVNTEVGLLHLFSKSTIFSSSSTPIASSSSTSDPKVLLARWRNTPLFLLLPPWVLFLVFLPTPSLTLTSIYFLAVSYKAFASNSALRLPMVMLLPMLQS